LYTYVHVLTGLMSAWNCKRCDRSATLRPLEHTRCHGDAVSSTERERVMRRLIATRRAPVRNSSETDGPPHRMDGRTRWRVSWETRSKEHPTNDRLAIDSAFWCRRVAGTLQRWRDRRGDGVDWWRINSFIPAPLPPPSSSSPAAAAVAQIRYDHVKELTC